MRPVCVKDSTRKDNSYHPSLQVESLRAPFHGVIEPEFQPFTEFSSLEPVLQSFSAATGLFFVVLRKFPHKSVKLRAVEFVLGVFRSEPRRHHEHRRCARVRNDRLDASKVSSTRDKVHRLRNTRANRPSG